MTESTAVDTTVARALLYRFLGQAYSYPDTGLVESLARDGLWDQLRASKEALNLGARQTIDEMQATIKQYCGDTQKLLADLEVEYTYLFINAVPRVPASPYESVYLGQGSLMGEPVSEVIGAYREAGLIISEHYDSLPDHVSAELEFMFYLIQQEMKASLSTTETSAEAWRQRQNEFLSQHLLEWVPLFLEKVNGHARIPFYRLLAESTEAILNSDKNESREI